MKVFITGATGFIGYNLVRYLHKKNQFDIRIISRTKKKIEIFSDIISNLEIYYGDVTKKETLYEAVKDVDIIFHIAGLIISRDDSEFYKTNVLGTKNLFEAISYNNKNIKKIILLSSLAAAGPSYNNEILDESSTPHPINSYGKSKLLAEELTKDFPQLPVIILRPPAVYGPFDKTTLKLFKIIKFGVSPYGHVFPEKLSLIYVKDLVEFCHKAAISDVLKGVFFVSYPQIYSWNDIMQELKKSFKKKCINIYVSPLFIKILSKFSRLGKFFDMFEVFTPQKINELSKNWVCNPQLAIKTFNYNPIYSLQKGIQETVNWYKVNSWI